MKFCLAVQREFRIPAENVYNVGDEIDSYFGSLYKKSIDARHTANSEIDITRKKLREWYAKFPLMKLCTSNHGMRWAKKASEAEIPSQMMRAYQEVLQAPRGWIWRDEWRVKTDHLFRVIHGVGYSGKDGARNAAIDAGISTAIGHLHSFGGAWHIHTAHRRFWAMNTGCLVDEDAIAFEYGKYSRNKPTLGLGVVTDGGRTPIYLPFERFR